MWTDVMVDLVRACAWPVAMVACVALVLRARVR